MALRKSVSHVLGMGWPILFFLDDGLCPRLFLGDMGWSGAGMGWSRAGKVPKETAWAPNGSPGR